MKKKVVIIGAGPAGLTAAYKLLNDSNNYEVVLIEEEKNVGGISKTVNYKGNRIDIGGHRFFSKNKEVMDFWENILPLQGKPSYDDKVLERKIDLNKKGPNPEKEDKVLLKRQRVSRIYYLKKFFDYPISLKFKTFQNMGLINTIKSGFSYLKSIFIKKEETSLENFYINRFGKELYSMFFEKYTEKVWGRHPSKISADWGKQRIKGLSIITVLKDSICKVFNIKAKTKQTSLIEEFYYPKYGPGQMWETVLEEIINKKGKILKEHKVIKINKEKGIIKSIICQNKNNKVEIKGDIFISTMPIKDLINDLNNTPKSINEIAKNLPYRDFITVGLLTNKLNIKNETNIKTINNIVPDCWIYVQESEVTLGRIQIFNNWSPYMVDDIKNNVWIGLEYFTNENSSFWNKTDKEIINYAKEEIDKISIISKENIKDACVIKVKKAYPAYFDSYKDIDKIITYLNKIDNLYCIGRNGQHRYNNMDHSMLTALECVNNIINNIKDKTNIWRVNTEQEYHEGDNDERNNK